MLTFAIPPNGITADWALVLLIFFAACSQQAERVWSEEEEGYRVAPLHSPVGRPEGFTAMSARRTGIAFANRLSADAWAANRHYLNGSGVAVGDINGDEWPDVFFAGLEAPNALYLNLGGWQFEEVAAQAGVAAIGVFTTGAVMVDIDGDADLDLLTTSMGGGASVFRNDGSGFFQEITQAAGVSHTGGATSMALADVDGDSDLDLYVGYYKARTVKDLYPSDQLIFERVVNQEGEDYSIVPVFAEHYRVVRQGNRLMRFEYAEPDRFYLNDGAGHFESVPFAAGTFRGSDGHPIDSEPHDWALSVRFQDLNGDGFPDLFVCNDFESPDHFWLGDGQGGFSAVPAVSVRKTSQSTMSIAAGDVNSDGITDIFLADMLSTQYSRRQRQHQVIPPEVTEPGDSATRIQVMQNMLLLGRTDGTFVEVAQHAGLAASEWTWGSAFLDVDLDGHEDLILTTGHAYDAMDGDAQMRSGVPGNDWRRQLLNFPDLDLKNLAFRNLGDATFEPVPDGWGLGMNADVSHGFALADLDLDGDLDVVINRLDDVAGIFRNGAAAPRIAVKLRGAGHNSYGIGAQIRVFGDGMPPRQKEVLAGGFYLSSSEALHSFAVAEGATIAVHWRSGLRGMVRNVQAGHIYEIMERDARSDSIHLHADPPETLMIEVFLPLQHHEELYDDFGRQPLLPRRLSQRGPAVALADLYGDGLEDVLMGGSRGRHLMYVRNLGDRYGQAQVLGPEATGDHAGLVVMPNGTVIVGNANYERTPQEAGDLATLTALQDVPQTVTFGPETPGPLVLSDFDGDQRLDLFVGGHFVPGLYPVVASSRVYHIVKEQLVLDEDMSAALANVGLVSGAASGDLDGDGDMDLALATDWGPVRIMLNDGSGILTDHTATLGMAIKTGWWNGVAMGDFDGDGRLDLAATNWGTNTLYSGTDRPQVVHYGDIDRNGILDIIESHYDATLQDYGMVRDLRVLSHAIPPLLGRVRSYREFSVLSLDALFGSVLNTMARHEASELRSIVLMNRGNRFEAAPLPAAAQWAPAFAPVVADFDGDGAEDLFLSQNFFATPATTPRMDAGRGLLLRGNGQGGFEVMSHSGIAIYGEQRGAATGDINHDGRPDLVVGQNAAPAKLFLNSGGAPGLRVVLRDPGEGIGAVVRLRYVDGTLGPARVIASGSGYWSQNASTQVLGSAGSPESVWVRWPGGIETEHPLAEGQGEIIVGKESGE